MEYRYTPKYVRETLNYQAGEKVKHGDYNRNLNLLNVAVDNNTEALRKLMNDGGVAPLNAMALDDAILRRYREHVLEDNDEQVPSSKAVYQHVEEIKDNIDNSILNIDNILLDQGTEMTNINLRIQVVNSLIAQYGERANEIEDIGDRLRDQFEFTYGTLHGGEAGQVLGKQSSNDLDYTWLDRIPGPEGPQGEPFLYEDFTPEQLLALTGPQGEPGEKGDPFVYEDFTPEQLEALTGPAGPAGPEGPEGPEGPIGPEGPPGADGANGVDGTNGTNGVDGTNGIDGEDGQGVPVGGTTGQALVKNSNNDYDTEWRDISLNLQTLLDFFYPIGTIYETTSTDLDTTTKMDAHFGGTWIRHSEGRMSIGYKATGTFNTLEKTGGAETHTNTLSELFPHTHVQNAHYHASLRWMSPTGTHVSLSNHLGNTSGYQTGYTSATVLNTALATEHATATNQNTGGGQAYSIMNPYVVTYKYKRIA